MVVQLPLRDDVELRLRYNLNTKLAEMHRLVELASELLPTSQLDHRSNLSSYPVETQPQHSQIFCRVNKIVISELSELAW